MVALVEVVHRGAVFRSTKPEEQYGSPIAREGRAWRDEAQDIDSDGGRDVGSDDVGHQCLAGGSSAAGAVVRLVPCFV